MRVKKAYTGSHDAVLEALMVVAVGALAIASAVAVAVLVAIMC